MTSSSGILLLDKPEGITSAKAIAIARRSLNLDKIGHSGTLDPFATGLLVCFTGRATKLASFAEKGDKIYSGVIRFGIATDTDDITGNVIAQSENLPSESQILKIISEKFNGLIEQYPPKVSAIKINGERAYKLARSGAEFEVPRRQVSIHSFEAKLISESLLKFRIKCSVGTYIRSIARDLGEFTGSLASLAELRREYSLPFDVSQAQKLENLSPDSILSWPELFPQALKLSLSEGLCRRIQNGQAAALRQVEGEFGSQIRDFRQIIFYPEKSLQPLGLLLNNGKSLEFRFCEIL